MSLRYALLTLLQHHDLSGYELLDWFDGSVGFVWHATHPQIYRELAKLAEDAWVTVDVVAQSGRPDKKVYAITAAGRAALVAWASEPAPPQKMKDELMLRAFSFALVERERALASLGEHRDAHAARLARYRALHAELVAGPPHPFRTGSLLTIAAGIGYEALYVGWCEWAASVLQSPSFAGLATPPGVATPPRPATTKAKTTPARRVRARRGRGDSRRP